MKLRNYILFCIVALLFSCNDKNKKNDINILNEKKNSENVTNKQNTAVSKNGKTEKKEDSTVNKRYFIDEIWQCNLPSSSAEAIKLGYIIEREEKAHEPKDPTDWTYLERSGYDSSFTCVNDKNTITYWENDKKVKIFDFESIDSELLFLNYNFIGKNIKQIINDKKIGIPKKNGDVINYDNLDFEYNLYFENNICKRIEYRSKL